MDQEDIFYRAYSEAKKNHNVKDSISIAQKVLNERAKKRVKGKKTFSLDTSSFTGNIIDIVVGYPKPDTEEIYTGKRLNYDGWKKIPNKDMTFDINHFSFDANEGIRNDLPEEWHNFGVKVSDWYYDNKEDCLKAKAHVPEDEKGKKFLEDYKKGKYGVSIEYEGIEKNNEIIDWKIIGGTFHEDPSYTETKPKVL